MALDGEAEREGMPVDSYVVCGRCGTSYAPEVFRKMPTAAWQRRDGILCEVRRCLCASGWNATLSVPHPELGADVVLYTFAGSEASNGGHPARLVAIDMDHYVARINGERVHFARGTSPAAEVDPPMGEVFRREVSGDELTRLRAWAKSRGR